MSWRPIVRFEKPESARILVDEEYQSKLSKGAVVSNTARSIYEATKPTALVAPTKKVKLAERFRADPSKAMRISDSNLDRSDETAVAINPKNRKNVVGGAATFNGQQYTNSAYVTLDEGKTWKTVTTLVDASEGAGIAFDGFDNCYYVSMQGGMHPVCVVSRDGGLTWSQPAHFGYGDKTAVAARGKIALCGFDRLNEEACAFTLDGGMNWTVHDFADGGLGTAPLISYDEKYFYIIYAASDKNLKIYVSPDQGQTWTGPHVIVSGNAWQSPIPGPLSYEGGALTSPGTNVATDESGRIHVLYIDSDKQVPMYTSSSDHGLTWSPPVNVDQTRSNKRHMWPCLSCSRDGYLQGGSVLYDEASKKYSILRHVKPDASSDWTTAEDDTGPWPAAGPSPGYRIGFGDYFDCDTFPKGGIDVMAWSETRTGQQPWQSWARIRKEKEEGEGRRHRRSVRREKETIAIPAE